MTKKNEIGLFWLREDFRFKKNYGLHAATKNHKKVVVFYLFKESKFINQGAQRWWVSKSLNLFKKKLSIVIPVYNSEKSLITLVQKIRFELIKKNNYDVEIILINDGSSNKRTSLYLKKIKSNKTKIINLSKIKISKVIKIYIIIILKLCLKISE